MISSPTSSTPLLPACFLNHETRKTIIRVMKKPELYHARIPSFRVFASYLQYCLRHPRNQKKKRQMDFVKKKNRTPAYFYPRNTVYVSVLAFSLSLYRHPSICILLSHFTSCNKQQENRTFCFRYDFVFSLTLVLPRNDTTLYSL